MDEKITAAEEIFDTLPDLAFFESLPRSGTDDFFFEGLISMVRTAVLSLQSGIHLEKNKRVKNLSVELINLKKDYAANFFRIQEIERTLSELSEQKLRSELENYKIFDRLNSEKITPYFMKLARVQNKTPDISKIRGDRNETLSEKALGDHVTGTYHDL
jgi:hypothetical protein